MQTTTCLQKYFVFASRQTPQNLQIRNLQPVHTVLVNTTEIVAYPETAIRNLAGLKRGPKRPQMAKIKSAYPIRFSRRIYTTLLAHQISLQSEIFALPCFRYLRRHYPREIGKNGRAFYPLLACSNPCFFSFTSTFKNSLSQW